MFDLDLHKGVEYYWTVQTEQVEAAAGATAAKVWEPSLSLSCTAENLLQVLHCTTICRSCRAPREPPAPALCKLHKTCTCKSLEQHLHWSAATQFLHVKCSHIQLLEYTIPPRPHPSQKPGVQFSNAVSQYCQQSNVKSQICPMSNRIYAQYCQQYQESDVKSLMRHMCQSIFAVHQRTFIKSWS